MDGADRRLGRRRVLRGLGLGLVGAPAAPHAEPGAPFIDAQVHIVRGAHRLGAIGRAVPIALAAMDARHVRATLLVPPPYGPYQSASYGLAELRAVASEHPGRFGFLAGGESLNPLIQQTAPAAVPADVAARFVRLAEAIAAAGAAGFGELAALHFRSEGAQMYQSVPADHPLFLTLADIAARHRMPIGLHMEAVPRDMPLPPRPGLAMGNATALPEDIGGLERLLDHNPQARIVWLHAGWDLTGARTVRLMRGLLHRHPNLFMSVKSDRHGTRFTAPFTEDLELKPAWLDMFDDFAERFVIGSDQFYSQDDLERLDRARRLIDLLPADLARRIGRDNVARIYRLPAGLA